MNWSDLRGLVAVGRREYQLSCRGASFWGITALVSLLALWRAGSPGTTPALASYQAWQTAVLGLGALATLMAGAAAARDRRHATLELVLAKPAGATPQLVVVRFLAVWLSLLSIVVVMLVAASLGQVLLGGTAWRPAAYLHAWLVSVLPIGLASALGFSLASLFTTPLASAVAAIYWVAIPLTRAHIPLALDLTPSQNWSLSAPLAAALVALSAALHARHVRGRQRMTVRMAWTAALLFALAGVAALGVAFRGDDALLEADPTLHAMAGQTALLHERAPGFWLTDAAGRVTGLSDFAGRTTVLVFWTPAVPASARVLSVLSGLAKESRREDAAYISICLDRDPAAFSPFAAEVDPRVRMLWDRGRHFGRGMEWADSPIAVAYDVPELPMAVVLDRDRRIAVQFTGEVNETPLRRAVLRVAAEGAPTTREP